MTFQEFKTIINHISPVQEWEKGTDYIEGCLVKYSNNWYLCLKPNKNQEPSETNIGYWNIIKDSFCM